MEKGKIALVSLYFLLLFQLYPLTNTRIHYFPEKFGKTCIHCEIAVINLARPTQHCANQFFFKKNANYNSY